MIGHNNTSGLNFSGWNQLKTPSESLIITRPTEPLGLAVRLFTHPKDRKKQGKITKRPAENLLDLLDRPFLSRTITRGHMAKMIPFRSPPAVHILKL